MSIYYTTTRWRTKRAFILKRDGYMCQECKKYGKRVEATTVHHIKTVEEHPELAFDNKNLISLCAKCHNKAHPEKGGGFKYKNRPPPFRLKKR